MLMVRVRVTLSTLCLYSVLCVYWAWSREWVRFRDRVMVRVTLSALYSILCVCWVNGGVRVRIRVRVGIRVRIRVRVRNRSVAKLR
jgi:hypothetical protein